jgi:hypothetical protein
VSTERRHHLRLVAKTESTLALSGRPVGLYTERAGDTYPDASGPWGGAPSANGLEGGQALRPKRRAVIQVPDVRVQAVTS